MYCSKCGNEIIEGSVFCSSCGNKIEQVNNNTIKESTKPQNDTINEQHNSTEQINKNSKPRNRKNKIIIFIIIGIVAIGILVSGIVLINKEKNSDEIKLQYNEEIRLQYNVKYVYEDSYITFFEDGTYTRNVEGITTANYTFNSETKEIICKEIQNVDGYEMDLEMFFKYLNESEIQKTSMKVLGIVPNGIEFGEIYSTENTLKEKQEDYDLDSNSQDNNTSNSNNPSYNDTTDSTNKTKREELLDNFKFFIERGFYEFTEKEYSDLKTYSDAELQKEWDKISKIVETQDKYDTKYREQLSEIFKKTINVELNSNEDSHYIYTPSNKVQPKARVEYVAINENGIKAIYYSVEMTLTITDKQQNKTEETTTKKYYKTTNINELNNIIKINNYDTKSTQDEIDNAIAIVEKPIVTAHLSGLPYTFYYVDKYVLYYLSEEGLEWLNEFG